MAAITHTGSVEILDDTAPEIRARIQEANCRRTVGDRIVRTFDLVELNREMATALLRMQHPDATEPEWRRELARRFLPRDLAADVVAELDRLER